MSNKTNKITVNVTEEEYQADLALGLTEDEVLKPGRHQFRRGGFLARHGLKPDELTKPAKVRISINLDEDVLTYFKERATQPNAAPYQTQINNVLRDVMIREKGLEYSTLPPQLEAIVSNQQFIKAVAERIKAQNLLDTKQG